MQKLIRLLIQPSSSYFWGALFVLRILLTFFVRNNSPQLQFQQAIHPPYLLVYGDQQLNSKYLSWEWKPQHPLRSTLLTYLNAWPFLLSKLLGVYFSRIYWVLFLQHSCLIFLGDYWFFQLARALFKDNHFAVQVSFFFKIANSSSLMSQQISNNAIQSVLFLKVLHSIITLSIKGSTYKPHVQLASLLWITFIIRPTAVINFIPLILLKVYEIQSAYFLISLVKYLTLTLPLYLASILLDSHFYGRFVITAWHFFQVNILQGVASQFGSEPFSTSFTYYLPYHYKLMTLFLPAAIFHYLSHCVYFKRAPYLLVIFLFSLVLFGLVPHKEERFLLPILPLGYLMLGLALADFLEDKKDKTSLQLYIFVALALEIAFFQAYQNQYQALPLIQDFTSRYLNKSDLSQTTVGMFYSYQPGPFLPLIHPKQFSFNYQHSHN